MSVLQRKIRNFLDSKRDLESQYKLVIKSQPDASSSGLQDLYEFDQLCYSYHALKSYYDISRSTWDSDYRNLLDDLANIVSRMEEKIPVTEILTNAPQLKVVRRQLRENAKEGGKVAFSMVQSNADMESFQGLIVSLDINSITVDSASSRQSPSLSKTPTESEPQKAVVEKPQEAQKVSPPKQPATQHQQATPKAPATTQDLPAPTQEKPLPTAQTPTKAIPKGPKGAFPTSPAFSPPKGPKGLSASQTPTGPKALKTSQQPHSSPGANFQRSNFTPSKPSPLIGQKRSSQSSDTPQKRQKQPFFTHLNDWTPEHVQCIFKCAIMSPHRVSEAIKQGFKETFGVDITLEAAHSLQSHYGILPETMNDYKYYIQAFRAVASNIYDNRHKYVTEPWAELKRMFSRRTNLTLSDDDVKGRYELFILHRQTYGNQGEPPSNYESEWNAFHRVYRFRTSQKKSTTQSFFSSANAAPAKEQPSPATQPASYRPNSFTWTPQAIGELVKAQAETDLKSPGRILLVQRLLRQAGYDTSLEEIITKSGEKEVMSAINEQQRIIVRRQFQEKYLNGNNGPNSQNRSDPRTPASAPASAATNQSPNKGQPHTYQRAPQSSPAAGSTSSVPQKVDSTPSKPKEAAKDTPQSPGQANASVQTSSATQNANSPSPSKETEALPQGVKKVVPKAGQQSSHFDNLIEKVSSGTRPNWHYENRFKDLPFTAFWDFEKNRTIAVTVDHISSISKETQNPTERVARANLIKLIMLRFLRLHHISVSEDFLEARLIKMMEKDVFDSTACRLINDQIMKK
ncbi:hypothetical protein FT663_00327 [Candidozyma haemuli var. vulneris]|uniref:Uncharacterized protein n=1 Tax=Candidozyma haemuli TaxID=45357 RepID=A0A2V1AQW3_9ASCO|nr:hypothetical protein CXQ85_002022 [[Candida] haemuloni]KAF3992984.1 hypothetical protein FT662_00807 [[Candida] haemuloni var. vulneris]KAF3995580.1 hypothetical protein FT663_00327 [[Candida] haemuloni var. vulneris]PVH20238.1 hypothetical protein CXQ85_002022 [[Candida] haemuloni]